MPDGTLYVVATPIGNLDDLSHRAVAILSGVDLVVCEDTRHTRKLLERYAIRRPVGAYHEFNETAKAESLIKRLSGGHDLALVSDAGTPTVSDPGFRLIRMCRHRNIPVIPIPGPTSAIAALSVSGLPTDEFRFVGFLPPRKEARRRRLEELRSVTCTLIFFEAPRRVRAMLRDIGQMLGDREAFVGREMTKLHEDYSFGPVSELATRVREQGEVVVVVAGAGTRAGANPQDPVDLKALSRQAVLKTAAARLGVTRNQLYDVLYRKSE